MHRDCLDIIICGWTNNLDLFVQLSLVHMWDGNGLLLGLISMA